MVAIRTNKEPPVSAAAAAARREISHQRDVRSSHRGEKESGIVTSFMWLKRDARAAVFQTKKKYRRINRKRNEQNQIFLFLWILLFIVMSRNTTALDSLSNHTNNVAILVQSSPFFHNYRHSSNILSVYQALKRFGNFTDDNIILMMAEEIPFNARNARKGSMVSLYNVDTRIRYPEQFMVTDIWDNQVELDYIGTDVTVDALIQVLLGPDDDGASSNRFLSHMNEHTNVLLYLTGHGGETFFKFRDYEELRTQDITQTITRMKKLKRFHELLIISDTCQAYTLSPNNHGDSSRMTGDEPVIENVYTIASSLKGQYSYSHHSDVNVGVSVVDRYSFEFVQFMNQRLRWKNMHRMSLKTALVDSMYSQYGSITGSDVGWDDIGCKRKLDQVPMSDFFVMRKHRENVIFLDVDSEYD